MPRQAPPRLPIEVPNFLREQILQIVMEAKESAEVGPEQWERLAFALNQYYADRSEWEGYLSAAQADALEKVRSHASELVDRVAAVRAFGADWYLSAELQADWPVLEAGLKKLSELEIKTPRVKRLARVPLTSPARANLQRRLDEWWRDVTGKAARPDENRKAPFMRFMEQVMSLFPEEEQLGHSYKPIKDRQAEAYEARRAVRKLAKKMKSLTSSPANRKG
jgi:hypothetical protein